MYWVTLALKVLRYFDPSGVRVRCYEYLSTVNCRKGTMLNTQLLRNNEPLPLRWGWWHISCLFDAIRQETGTSESPATYVPYTYIGNHTYVDEEDGEVFIILPNDTFDMWR